MSRDECVLLDKLIVLYYTYARSTPKYYPIDKFRKYQKLIWCQIDSLDDIAGYNRRVSAIDE